MSIDEFFVGNSYFSSPKRSSEKESVAEVLDIKGSAKSDTTFVKRREPVEKELLQNKKKKLKMTKQCKFRKNVKKNQGNVKLLKQDPISYLKILDGILLRTAINPR